MKWLVLVLLLLSLLTARESKSTEFFLLPSITTATPGLLRHWVWQGAEVGLVVKKHHTFSITARYSVRTENYSEVYDPLDGKNSWSSDYFIWGTAYGSYIYDYSFTPFLRVGAGLSMGYQYVESDRNFDTTGIYTYRVTNEIAESVGKGSEGKSVGNRVGESEELHIRHEAEGRSHSFGGPLVQVALGWNRIYFHTRFRLNMGIRENWGWYSVKESDVSEIYFPEEYTITDVKIIDSGWQKPIGNTLFKEFYLLPEFTFGILIFI